MVSRSPFQRLSRDGKHTHTWPDSLLSVVRKPFSCLAPFPGVQHALSHPYILEFAFKDFLE